MLIVALPFGARLKAADVAAAIAAGLRDGAHPQPDLCPLDREAAHAASGLPADFDTRMRAARAVVIAAPRLDEDTLLASLPFEIATRARQAGVPCCAVARENALDRFDARILDLQAVLEARTAQALQKAGRELSRIL